MVSAKELERMMKLQDVILKAMAKRITWMAAAEIAGVSDRTMRRMKDRYQESGYDGLFDQRRGKRSIHRSPMETAEQVLALYQEKYFDFSVLHFHGSTERNGVPRSAIPECSGIGRSGAAFHRSAAVGDSQAGRRSGGKRVCSIAAWPRESCPSRASANPATGQGTCSPREQARDLLAQPALDTIEGKRDRAILAVLLGCALRRSELAALECAHIQQRDGRWVFVDLVGKGKKIRTVPIPPFVKVAIDDWTAAAGLSEGPLVPASALPKISGKDPGSAERTNDLAHRHEIRTENQTRRQTWPPRSPALCRMPDHAE
jgi:hypothetical protein